MSKKRLLSRAEVDVNFWEERDRLHIAIVDKKTGQRTIAEWWDDDARSMFEDGFFKRGVELKRSVINYAEEMGLLSKLGRNPGVRKNIFTFNNPGNAQRILAENFVRGANSGVASSMYIHGSRIYSYGPHFPIAQRNDADGTILIRHPSKKAPSKTTAGHISLVVAAARQVYAPDSILYDTADVLKGEAKGPAAYSNPRGGDNQVEAAARAAGLAVATWAPGDGVTRYRFFLAKGGSVHADYHQGDGIYTALGRKDALAFISAYGKGRSARTNPLTHRETSTVVESARFHARMARSITPGAPYRSHLLGVAEGQLNVAAQYGRGKNRGRAGTMVSAIDRMAMAKGGPYMRFSHKPPRRNPAVCPNPCVRGDKLPYHLQQEILNSFGYRWTKENEARARSWFAAGRVKPPRIPLITDAQWLREHAFYVTKGGKLDARRHHAEPYYLADDWKKGDPRPNPLLQTVLAANPGSSGAELKRQMVAFLKKEFRGFHSNIDGDDAKFCIEGAIYWFANDWHGGGGSPLYQILSTSPFRPGPSVRGPEDEIEQMMYDALVQKYAPKKNPYVVVDRASGRVSSVERGRDDRGARARAIDWADWTTADGRPQEVHRVDRGATRIRVGDPWRRPNPASVRTYKVPGGLEGKVASLLRNAYIWAQARPGEVLTVARPEIARRAIAHIRAGGGGWTKANPLTRREAASVLRDAHFDVRHGSNFAPGSFTRTERAGQAFGKAKIVVRHGPRAAKRAAWKISDRARKMARTTLSNPGVRLPKPGTKMTVAQAMELARRIGNRDLISQCQKAMRLQKKSDRGTKCVIWKTLPLGSSNKIDTVVAMTHYGSSPEDMYKPPSGSKKGPHMYRHKWKRSVPVLASPSGKAIIKLMGSGQKVGDWMRG